MPLLSIIITHHQTPVLLKLCLKSIVASLAQTTFKREIFVVDSQGDTEVQATTKEKFPEVKFISFGNNVGYAKIVNAGLGQAQGAYCLILNADIIIIDKAIEKMIDFMQSHPQVGVVGPKLLTFTNQVQESCFRQPEITSYIAFVLARRTFLGKTNWGKKILTKYLQRSYDEDSIFWPVDWLQGSAMMVSQRALLDVGPMDERYFMYFEDTDWCRRFWQMGFQVIYLTSAQMAHYYYRASHKWGGLLDIILNKYTRLHIVSAIKYFWKWRHSSKKYEKN